MRHVVLFLVVWCTHAAHAAEGETAVSTNAAAPKAHRFFSLSLRSGLIFENPDRAVISRWKHVPEKSFKHGLGFFATFPPSWPRVKFITGGEYQYMTAREELDGAYRATIDVTITQFLVTGGAQFTPAWANGFGGTALAGVAFYGKKKSKLDAEGFSQDLGEESPVRENWLFKDIPLLLTFSVFYDWGFLRPHLTYETDSTLTAGASYVF